MSLHHYITSCKNLLPQASTKFNVLSTIFLLWVLIFKYDALKYSIYLIKISFLRK
jgi:hypothetical protein